MTVKALVLFSGGLDSLLATRLMLEQPVEVEALHGVSLFNTFAASAGRRLWPAVAAERLGVRLHIIDANGQILDTVNNARHGFGSGANPCLDCRAAMLRRGRELMDQIGASFLVTGEVVGQRPMSQRRFALDLIEREAGLEGLVVRPLTALNLPPTIPEERGWIDRKRLLDFRGRSRKPQMELAARFGMTDYPGAAGGCLLTDPGYAARIQDLLRRGPVSLNDAHLCKLGRHFRLSDWGKAIVGRNAVENPKLATLARRGEWLLDPLDIPGPTTLLRAYADPAANPHAVRGTDGRTALELAAALTLGYSKAKGPSRVWAWQRGGGARHVLVAEPVRPPCPGVEAITG